MTSRTKGDYFERQTRAALAATGWIVVRSAGSFGIADLVAMRDGAKPLLVSCKLGGRIGPRERADLIITARAAGALPILAERTRNGWVGLSLLGPDNARQMVDELHVPRKWAETNA